MSATCNIRQVQIDAGYDFAVLCGNHAVVIFRVECPNGHTHDSAVCEYHRAIIMANRAGNENYCGACAQDGNDHVVVTWREIDHEQQHRA
jgi:hypothetical protein